MILPDGRFIPGAPDVRKAMNMREKIILGGATVHPSAGIGEGVLIQENSTIAHGCLIGDWVTVCPGANLAGDVIVGDGVWVGINACAVQGVTIGEWSFIGAGSVVVKDIPPRVLAYGNPCRVIRELKPEELGRIL